MYISGTKIAEQIIKYLSDNRITMTQWKYDIPEHITDQHIPILINAKNLAEGIQESLYRKELDMPEAYVVSSREYNKVTDNEGNIYNDSIRE